jgi:S1-C subfamily serine protease
VLVVAAASWAKINSDKQATKTGTRLDQIADSARRVQQESQGRVDSLRTALGRADNLSKQLQPAEIADKYSSAVVQVDFSWKLTYRGTGGQVYHKLVPNRYKCPHGNTCPIIDNGRSMIPAYVQVGNVIEPALTLDPNQGRPIGLSSHGSGFVVTSNGFILTNRHVAYNWQAWYRFDADDVGPIIGRGGFVSDANGRPVLTRPPTQWIPSETKQAGPKGDIGDFQARVEYLMVRFPKDPTPFEASNVRPSQRHDVALIKVDAPPTLQYVNMVDTYEQTRQGDAVTIMGYPSISDEVITLIKSRDMFNREIQERVLPLPTLSTGNVGKILRAADAEVRDGFMTFALGGDTYQLTANSTGGGNSGGPMFDANGNVTGIFFASKRGDAHITFAIPIRYGLELLRIGDPTAR